MRAWRPGQIKRLERSVSVVGLGTWQLGADWGDVSEDAADGVLETAADAGVTFFDTADVYGDGRSETFCGRLRARHPEVFVATKMGRRVAQETINYNRDNFLAWNDRSRENLGMETLDLVQLHCPPDGVYENDAVFDALDEMVSDGRIAAYGVSVETVAQALSAIARPHVATRADHPQLLSPQAAGGGAAGGARGGRRDHRARPAGLGSAVGPL